MAKYCLDKLHPKKVSYFDYQIEDYFCERAAVKKIDLLCGPLSVRKEKFQKQSSLSCKKKK